MWTTVALLTTLSLAPNAAPALKLDNVRSTHGILGPARASEKYIPGDSLTLNFDIDGITVDSKGKVLYSIAIEVTNAADKSVMFRQKGQNQETVTVFGGNRVQGFAHLDLGTEQAPGDYSMTVTVTDLASQAVKDLSHKFTVVKPDFALVRLKTSSDRDGEFPVPVLGQGQTIWLNFGIVGFGRDKTTKQPSVLLELNVIDDAGKATLDKPLSKVVGMDVPEKNLAIPLQFPVSLTRAGKFTFEVTATDNVTKKTIKFALPLNVQAVK
jgi:hypothetical protein